MIYVANWKTYLSITQSCEQIQACKKLLPTLQGNQEIIICPTFVALGKIAPLTGSRNLSLGAQDCSPYAPGAHTGQVAAQTLAELGCCHSIVGHSETRTYTSAGEIEGKIAQLANCGITPILCIGQATEQEIAPAFHALKKNLKQIIIAYEPESAIGTDQVPTQNLIEKALNDIVYLLKPFVAQEHYRLIYGGSVSRSTIQLLKNIALLDGFLVGRASTQAQDFIDIIRA